jgi:hypothetical protein
MNSYNKADPEIQVLQIASSSNKISARARSRNQSSPFFISKAIDPNVDNSVQDISIASFNNSSNRSFTSKKLPAMIDYEIQKIKSGNGSAENSKESPWTTFSQKLTCCCFPMLLSTFGMKGYHVQQAWREKVLAKIHQSLLC